VDPPSDKRVPIARVARVVGEHVLIVTEREPGSWTRLQLKPDDEDPINSNDAVMALPGYKANVLVGDRGKQVEVRLWGNVPEQMQYRVLESRVKFHVPPDGFDADITLLGGRIYLKSKQATGSKVRVRLGSEVWDLTLPGTESSVLVELITWFEPGTPYALKGGPRPKQKGALGWCSERPRSLPHRGSRSSTRLRRIPKSFGLQHQHVKRPATHREPSRIRARPCPRREFHTQLRKVLSNMADAVTEGNGTRAVVTNRLDPAPNLAPRDLVARLAVYSQTAMADGPDAPNLLKPLVDELGKKDPWYTRQAVVTALVHWLPRDPTNTATCTRCWSKRGLRPTRRISFSRCFVGSSRRLSRTRSGSTNFFRRSGKLDPTEFARGGRVGAGGGLVEPSGGRSEPMGAGARTR